MTGLLRRIGVGLALATIAGVTVTSSANAAPVQEVTHTGTMTLVTVTRALGSTDSTGQVQVLLSNGHQIKIPAANLALTLNYAKAMKASVHPDGTVTGNCGSSWVNLYERSDGHPVKTTTGFHVIHAAVAFTWDVSTKGPSGSGYLWHGSYGGGLFFDSTWSTSHSSHKDYKRGIYEAVADGDAILDTGGVCVSGEPYADRNL